MTQAETAIEDMLTKNSSKKNDVLTMLYETGKKKENAGALIKHAQRLIDDAAEA